jgi:hypothetical protein
MMTLKILLKSFSINPKSWWQQLMTAQPGTVSTSFVLAACNRLVPGHVAMSLSARFVNIGPVGTLRHGTVLTVAVQRSSTGHCR